MFRVIRTDYHTGRIFIPSLIAPGSATALLVYSAQWLVSFRSQIKTYFFEIVNPPDSILCQGGTDLLEIEMTMDSGTSSACKAICISGLGVMNPPAWFGFCGPSVDALCI